VTRRVALATCAELPDLDSDDQPLVSALAERGIAASSAVWDDPQVDWAPFDLVVLRSTWDYAERQDEFLAWARSLSLVRNPVPVLEWGTDKERYLRELERASVPAVPTRFVPPGTTLPQANGPFVVKPAISAGGRLSAHFAAADAGAAAMLVTRIHAAGRTAMVQPFLDGEERSLVYVDGAYSHALARRAPLPAGEARDVLYLEEELAPATSSAAERATADAALALSPSALLYARVDLLGGLVLEVEVVEPSLYLAFGEGALDRLADAIAATATRRA
jgi:glutathione synthase/RimK-type ligase-like ATP-grasp enzyme